MNRAATARNVCVHVLEMMTEFISVFLNVLAPNKQQTFSKSIFILEEELWDSRVLGFLDDQIY